jgi:type I restriction enzyme S subunit
MIAGLKPYSSYKDSGVPWLGEVPEAWNVLRGRHLFEIKKRIAGEVGHSVLSVTQAGLRVKDVHSGEGQVSQDYSKYQIVKPGEFVMNSMDLLTGGVGIADSAGVTSPDYRVFAIRDGGQCRDRYVLHVFRTLYANRGFYAWGQGSAQLGRWRLPRKRFDEFPFPIPPVPEQAAIASFLDHADGRIKRYIRAKQRLIKLLEEQKQALIHRAVTRGLDPNVRLKPSGVEWLGEVPEHWDERPAKYFYREVDERSTSGSEELLSVSHITGVTPRSQKSITMFMASSYVGHKLCRAGDLVINTMWAWMAALGVSRQTGIISPSYGVYRPRRPSMLLGDYADLLLRARPYVSEYICRSTGIRSSRLRLYPEQFLRIKLVCPPIEEQQTILKWIASATATVSAAINRAQREIDLLREYRTSLIADVVTGKLDIREAAAILPDETEEPPTSEEAEASVEDDEETEAADPDAVREEDEA